MNDYIRTLDGLTLDAAAKMRIFDGIVERLSVPESARPRVTLSYKTFKAAAACAAAVLVCGTALGTGLYFGLGGDGNNGDVPNMIYTPRYPCYDMDYELELGEYDIDNVEMMLSYAFNEPNVRRRYDEVLKEAQEKGYGEVLKYEIILGAINDNYANYFYDLAIIRRFEIKNIDEFPFEEYMLNVVEKDGEIVERTYTHTENIVIPQELFVDCVNSDGTDRSNWIRMYFYERIEYEIGCTTYKQYFNQDGSLEKCDWSDGGKTYNDWSISSFADFEIVDDSKDPFLRYKLNGDKVEIYYKSVPDKLTSFKSKDEKIPDYGVCCAIDRV